MLLCVFDPFKIESIDCFLFIWWAFYQFLSWIRLLWPAQRTFESQLNRVIIFTLAYAPRSSPPPPLHPNHFSEFNREMHETKIIFPFVLMIGIDWCSIKCILLRLENLIKREFLIIYWIKLRFSGKSKLTKKEERKRK